MKPLCCAAFCIGKYQIEPGAKELKLWRNKWIIIIRHITGSKFRRLSLPLKPGPPMATRPLGWEGKPVTRGTFKSANMSRAAARSFLCCASYYIIM